ncbi:MAG: type II secretion system protein [Candidatus Kaiserbacteria bacterium]|nr:type II secretion system protein [Candidatus Kaiserbacteria bacterium]
MESFHLRRGLVSGFTLTELMVVLAIIVTITTVTLSSQSSFNKTIILANTAYDIALSLRSAETYGLAGRAVNGVTSAGYGLNFQKISPGSFTLFADTSPGPNASNCHGLPAAGASAPDAKSGNCTYDPGEKVMDYVLGNNIIVSDFCAYSFGGWSCAYAQGGGLSSLDIVFARPNPDPFINIQGTKACLTISSPQGGTRFISVAASGEITAKAPSCP